MKQRGQLIVVAGPTAVGKTAFTIALANVLNAPVVNCDSRQVYREMAVGTAVPPVEERAGIPHYFLQSHSIKDPLNAGRYETEAIALLDQLFEEAPFVILTGGSGLYIDAVIKGVDAFPPISPFVKKSLEQDLFTIGIDPLLDELKEKDPTYFNSVDQKNSRRIIRALEVIRTSGKPYSSFLSESPKKRGFDYHMIVLNRKRENLYNRINRRVDQMFRNGLKKEAEALYPQRKLHALNTVGYTELFLHFDGRLSELQAVDRIKQNTRRYAKRQLTWLRRYPDAEWIDLDEVSDSDALEHTRKLIAESTGLQP